MGEKGSEFPLFRDWILIKMRDMTHQSLANYLGKQRSTVTGYCSGNDKPPLLTLARIVNLFDGNPREIADFFQYERKKLSKLCDLLKKDNQPFDVIIKQAWNHLFNNRNLREKGFIKNALESNDYWIKMIDDRIFGEMDPLYAIEELKRVSIQLHGERIACFSSISINRSKIPGEVMEDFLKMQKYSIDLGENINNIDAFEPMRMQEKYEEGRHLIFSGLGQCYSLMAGAYFVARDYQRSVDYAKKALPLCGFDKNLKAETLRGLLLGLAHLERESEYFQVEYYAQELILDCEFGWEDTMSINCACAEGRELLGKDGGREFLKVFQEKIQDKRYAITYQPLKIVQMYKSQLLIEESELSRGLDVDIRNLLSIAEISLELAKYYGFERQKREIEMIMNNLKKLDK